MQIVDLIHSRPQSPHGGEISDILHDAHDESDWDRLFNRLFDQRSYRWRPALSGTE